MLESTTRDVLIVLVLLGAVVFLVAFTYFFSRQHYGHTAAKLIVPRRLGWLASIILSAIIVQVLFTNVSRQVLNIVMLSTLVLFGGALLWS